MSLSFLFFLSFIESDYSGRRIGRDFWPLPRRLKYDVVKSLYLIQIMYREIYIDHYMILYKITVHQKLAKMANRQNPVYWQWLLVKISFLVLQSCPIFNSERSVKLTSLWLTINFLIKKRCNKLKKQNKIFFNSVFLFKFKKNDKRENYISPSCFFKIFLFHFLFLTNITIRKYMLYLTLLKHLRNKMFVRSFYLNPVYCFLCF